MNLAAIWGAVREMEQADAGGRSGLRLTLSVSTEIEPLRIELRDALARRWGMTLETGMLIAVRGYLTNDDGRLHLNVSDVEVICTGITTVMQQYLDRLHRERMVRR